MRAGILTFHRAYNYGAILQAYALQKAIEQEDVESEIIDYLSATKRQQLKTFCYSRKIGFKGNISKFIKDFYRVRKNREFDIFMKKNMNVSKESYSSESELVAMDKSLPYDVYIVGSDQVWNLKNNQKDDCYLLTFVHEDSKKCSYAASVGHAVFDHETSEHYDEQLRMFRVLSVREESSIEQYGFLKNNNPKAVLDPTLLLSSKDYESIISPRIEKRRYAFLYTIADDVRLRKYARKMCKTKGIKLIDSKRSMSFFSHANPSDFLSFIKYADYIFTNSFHGTAFSLIMEKKLVTEVNTRRSLNNRSKDILKITGLLARDLDSPDFDPDASVEWNNVRERLNKLRLTSRAVLRDILGKY